MFNKTKTKNCSLTELMFFPNSLSYFHLMNILYCIHSNCEKQLNNTDAGFSHI